MLNSPYVAFIVKVQEEEVWPALIQGLAPCCMLSQLSHLHTRSIRKVCFDLVWIGEAEELAV